MIGWRKTPWDRRALGFDTYELIDVTEDNLKRVEGMPGHFTVRVPPLQTKQHLHNYGFYYCDTLIEPFCDKRSFQPVFQRDISVKPGLDPECAASMCSGVFKYDRFHRDFNIPEELADRRYSYWIKDIGRNGTIYGLWYENALAGFFACQDNQILLHAVTKDFKGKGLAKFFWSEACQALFKEGHEELVSSISATNMAVLNLYRSIGFAFRNPVDLYHKFNPLRI